MLALGMKTWDMDKKRVENIVEFHRLRTVCKVLRFKYDTLYFNNFILS